MQRRFRAALAVSATTLLVVGAGVAMPSAEAAAKPTVKKVSPASGSTAGGTTVTITGSGFAKGVKVSFGTTAAKSVKLISKTKITAVAPKHNVGVVDVRVKLKSATSTVVKADKFTYVAPSSKAPSITSITPASGAAGTTVLIMGSSFAGAAVTFGGVPGTSVVVAAGGASLTVKAPAHDGGAVAVAVTTKYGTATKNNAFTYPTAPYGGPKLKYFTTNSDFAPTSLAADDSGDMFVAVNGSPGGGSLISEVIKYATDGLGYGTAYNLTNASNTPPLGTPAVPGTPITAVGVRGTDILIGIGDEIVIWDESNTVIYQSVISLHALLPDLSSPSVDDLAVDTDGNIYVADKNNQVVVKVKADASEASKIAGPGTSIPLQYPVGVGVSNGAVYIADQDGLQILKLSGGSSSVVAGGGAGALPTAGGSATATAVTLTGMNDLGVSTSGDLYIPAQSGIVYKVDHATAKISVFAGGGSDDPPWYSNAAPVLPTSVAFAGVWAAEPDSTGKVFISDNVGHKIYSVG
jgi:hypothetical protein